MQADVKFFEVTKSFHNIFHGEKIEVTEEMLDTYLKGDDANEKNP